MGDENFYCPFYIIVERVFCRNKIHLKFDIKFEWRKYAWMIWADVHWNGKKRMNGRVRCQENLKKMPFNKLMALTNEIDRPISMRVINTQL